VPPAPRLSPTIQLNGGYFGDLLKFLGISERLTGQRIAAREPPPTFLLIESTRPYRSAFGMKSFSSLVAQLSVVRQPTPFAQQKAPVLLKQTAKVYLNY